MNTCMIRRCCATVLLAACGSAAATSMPPADPVSSVTLDVSALALNPGQTSTLHAILKDAAGTTLADRSVTWSTSNAAVATVDANGTVRAVSVGSAQITASSETRSASTEVAVSTVVVPVASVLVTPPSASIAIGASQQLLAATRDASGNTLSGHTITWSSLTPAIATVNGSGLVTAIAAGTVTIQATSDGINGTATITISAPVASISVTPANPALVIGATQQLTATIKDAQGNVLSGRNLVWSSLSAGVATVNATGLVTAVATGSTTIRAASEGINADVLVTVTTLAASVAVTPSTRTLAVGQTLQLAAVATDAQGRTLAGHAIAWTSLTPAVATVTSSGLVTAIGSGTVVVRGTADAAHSDATLTIGPAGFAVATMTGGTDPCVVTFAGDGYCWGYNRLGTVGDGTSINRSRPSRIVGGAGAWTIVSSQGGTLTCGLNIGAQPWCWGLSETGNGTITASTTPRTVVGGHLFSQVQALDASACALDLGGVAWCWGVGTYEGYVLGTIGSPSPLGYVLVPTLVSGGHTFVQLGGAFNEACGLTAAGAVWCWGDGAPSLGDGVTEASTLPIQPVGLPAIAQLPLNEGTSCVRAVSGDAWCWGNNASGVLGDGTTVDRSTPVKVLGGHSFIDLSAGYTHACGLTAAGVAWCWGDNSEGQLGDGTVTNRLTPVQVSGGHQFTRIIAGVGSYTCGIATDGQLWCWGNNADGAVGDGTNVNRSVPVLVTGP
jgi:uncharacterized protein YjdB/alpha-tubulin suppressor-like RCC1 family protein